MRVVKMKSHWLAGTCQALIECIPHMLSAILIFLISSKRVSSEGVIPGYIFGLFTGMSYAVRKKIGFCVCRK